ncbi:MAG: DUF2232 domain-containing protein [Gemmatimonadetes bacterium]|nr:MAG: DUF2232 domain-containing protein [Gemmatimonadota bacterium]
MSDLDRADVGRVRGWPRALALFAVVMSLSAFGVLPLIAIPFLVLVLTLGSRRLGALALAGVFAFAAFARAGTDGVWWLGRGWGLLAGGGFTAACLAWPRAPFVHRGLLALAGAGLGAAAVFAVHPGAWAAVDWMIRESIFRSVAASAEVLRALQSEGGGLFGEQVLAALYDAAEWQGHVFPALLGLATLAALGVAWWLYARLAHGSSRGLGPLRDFRFSDHLLWFLVLGLAAVVFGGDDPDGWGRAGANAVWFMGGLYALRGFAVVMFLSGGVSLLGGVALVGLMLFLGPILTAAALILGVSDTWLDLRGRARATIDST